MKILVYGAGVLGSYLAHILIRGGNQVTVLARGSRYDEIEEQGLIIRHVAQFRTTKDSVKLIRNLEIDDKYDAIFVVMQYTQLAEILPILAANKSKFFVLVGNNMSPQNMKRIICAEDKSKTVLFGFQETGGRREAGMIKSIHAGAKMAIGSLSGEDFGFWQKQLLQIFEKTKYKLIFRKDMEAYLICHVAFVMPIAYACYVTNGNLKKADRKLIYQIMEATKEAYSAIRENKIPIPAEDEEFVFHQHGKYYCMLMICAKTFVGRFAASDHAMNAIGEMGALSDSFDIIIQKSGLSTPNWNSLKEYLLRIKK